MASKSKSGSGSKTTSSMGGAKSNVITVRLSPKLKYGLELLSRKQHRPLSSVVTWAVEQLLNDRDVGLYNPRWDTTLEDLWDVDSADRLVRLANLWPQLLTYEQEIIVKAVKENGWWPKKGVFVSESLRDTLKNAFIDPGDNSVNFNF